MKIQTKKLTGAALNWAVGILRGWVTYPTGSKAQGKWFHTDPSIASHGQAPAQPVTTARATPAALTGENHAQLDMDSNASEPGQQRELVGALAVGQHVGDRAHETAGNPCAERDVSLRSVAVRNLRSFLHSATFKSESDRQAALTCVDVLQEARPAPPPAMDGEVVVTTDQQGRCVAVTRQDDEGRVLKIIWQAMDGGEDARPFPAMSPELSKILGTMCFQCITFAQALRAAGHQINTRAEDEQAAVLHWMLGHYFRSGEDGWREAAADDMKRMGAEAAARAAQKEKPNG